MERICKWFWAVVGGFLAGMILLGCQADEDVRRTPTGTPIDMTVTPTDTSIPPTSSLVPPTVVLSPSPTEEEMTVTATPVPTVTPVPPTATMVPRPTRPITLPGPIGDSQIAYQVGGSITAVEVIGNVAYVGVGPRLYVLDVSDPTNVLVIGVSGILPGTISSLVVDVGVVFAVTGDGVWLLDVSDPSHPVPLSRIPTVYRGQELGLNEGYLLIVDQNGGRPDVPVAKLLVFDVSDYESPVQRFEMNLPDIVSDFDFYEQYVYLSVGENAVTSEPGLLILDAAAMPELVTAAFLTEFTYSDIMLIENGILYLSQFGSVSYDLTDPLNPVEVSQFGSYMPVHTDIGKTENAILRTEFFCDVGTCGGMLAIYPLDRPPEQMNVYQVNAGFIPYDLSIAGNFVYVAAGSQLFVFDLSDVLSPRPVSRWRGTGSIDLIGEDGDRLFAFDDDELILSYYDLRTDVQLSFLNQQMVESSISSLVYSEDYVFWADFYRGVVVAEKEGFEVIASFQDNDFLEQFASHVLHNNSGLVFALMNAQLVIIDISEPTKPFLTYPIEIHADVRGSYESIFWQEPFLYAVEGNGRLSIIDVVDPTNPTELGWLELGRRACEMAVEGDFIYVLVGGCNTSADVTSELVVVDGSEPGNMKVVGRVTVPGVMRDLAVFEDYVFVANGDVLVLDVVERSQPRLISTVLTPGNAADLLVLEGLVYVADGAGGVVVIAPPED